MTVTRPYSYEHVSALNSELLAAGVKNPLVSMDVLPASMADLFMSERVSLMMPAEWGDAYTQDMVDPTWLDLFRAIDVGMGVTGDLHHLFVERIVVTNNDGIATVTLGLGS